VHLADSNRLVPGKGHFPFTEFLEALESGGFSGTFAVEAMPVPDVYDAAHAAITTWRNWQLG
jgi:sugar phosphate isomerase/epimerase